MNTDSPYAGGNVSLLCTCGSGVTSGTVKRYYKAAGANVFTDDGTIQTGVTIRTTITDTLPASYGGGQVYYRYEINNGENYAVTAQKTVTANSAPSTPATLTVPASIAGGSSIEVSWSASTDPDGNLAGYILERSTNGGTTWENVYQGAALSTTDAILSGTTRVRYRVKAYDTYGAESGYRLAPASGGDYTVTNNRAPTTPASPITVTPARLTPGASAVITWGTSSDPDGDAFEYVLERRKTTQGNAQAVWETVYTGYQSQNPRYTDTIGADWTSVRYRVKARDINGASSGYLTGETRDVIRDSKPVLAVTMNETPITSGANLGTIVNPEDASAFSMSYTASDADAGDTLTIREYVDGELRKTRTNVVRGESYPFRFRSGDDASTSYWKELLDGTHTIRFEVDDGPNTVGYAFRFLKNEGSCMITLRSPWSISMAIDTVVISICGSIPEGCLTSVEATLDGVNWESCQLAEGAGVVTSGLSDRKMTSANDLNETLLGGHQLFIHKFSDGSIPPTASFNYRIVCTAAEGKHGWISSVQGLFIPVNQ